MSAKAGSSPLVLLVGAVGACSLFSPSEAELSGGPRSGTTMGGGGSDGTAGAVFEGGAPPSGGEDGGGTSAGTGGTSAGAMGGSAVGSSGSSAGVGGTTSGGTSGGTSGAGGSTSCVADVTSKAPKASSLLDDFSDGKAAPTFRVDGKPETCAVELGGRVVVDLPQPLSAGYFCYYETLSDYDLTCDSVVLKVPEVAGPVVGVQTYLYVGPDETHRVMVVVENGGYQVSTDTMRFNSAGRYDAASPWWRLREDAVGGQRKIIFETSPDAATWTERYRAPRPFALNNVKVIFGAGGYQGTSSPGAGAFACYNAPAGCD